MKNNEISKAAAALGSIKTDKKAASSRENGKLGGRPTFKWSVIYNRAARGTCGRNEELVIEAATAKAAIKAAIPEFDGFGEYIPEKDFRWNGDLYCAVSGNWEESFDASKWEEDEE